MKNFNEKKGAVAMYAFLSIMFFVALLLLIYYIIAAKYKSELRKQIKIQDYIAQDVNKNKLNIAENPPEIYIYTERQLEFAGSEEYVYIPQDDIIAKFTKTAQYIFIPQEPEQKTKAQYQSLINAKKASISGLKIDFKQGEISNPQVKIGDIIKYDPTRGVTNTSLLSYTSPKGNTSGTTTAYPGNGVRNQTITATSSNNRWVVIGRTNGKLKLMLETMSSTYITIDGGQGWLYADRERHNLCKVFGYGYGADTTNITRYEVGNSAVNNEAKIEKITGSGARSITIEDLEEIGNIDTQFKISKNKNYGKSILNSAVKIPTVASSASNKASSQIYKDELKDSSYTINKTDNKFGVLQNKILNQGVTYWIAGRRPVKLYSTEVQFGLFFVNDVELNVSTMFKGDSAGNVIDRYSITNKLRPVVILKSDVQLVQESPGVYNIK